MSPIKVPVPVRKLTARSSRGFTVLVPLGVRFFITQPTGLKVGLSYIRELRKAGDPGVKVGWMAIGMQERAGIEMDDVATLTEEANERYGELVAGVQVQVIISGAFTR